MSLVAAAARPRSIGCVRSRTPFVRLTRATLRIIRGEVTPSIDFVRAGPELAIRRVIEACALPECRLLVAPGEPRLDGMALGETIPRTLAYHAHSGAFTGHRDAEWDVGVAFAPIVTVT